MTNYIIIKDSEKLSKIFDTAGDKLIVLMFFTKRNSECKRALSAFESSATNHNTSIFCVIDTDNWTGESRIVNINNITNMPKFEAFHQGNSLGLYSSYNEKEIEQIIGNFERYVMTHNNNKNNGMAQNNMANSSMGMANNFQFCPVNAQQLSSVQQQILNQAQMTNPQQYQFFVQNPHMLLQQAQRQIQLNQQMMVPNMMPTVQPNLVVPQMPNNMNITTTVPTIPTIPVMPTVQQNNCNNIIPTFEQMQQMFRIFQMMQQMGALNISTPTNNTTISNEMPQIDTAKKATEETIILSNGDKIIPLGDGKYGLVKKN
jgi:hypothetical protein